MISVVEHILLFDIYMCFSLLDAQQIPNEGWLR